MDRRSFLINSSRTLGAVLTYSFMSSVEAFVGNENIPLLLKPNHTETILYAINDTYDGYHLYLGKHPLDDQVPDVKWRELFLDHWGWSEKEGIAYLQENYEITKSESRKMLADDAPEDSINDWFYLSQSANAKAFFYLSSLDLGPDFGGSPDAAGEIKFVEGYHPGNDTRMVEVPENISLSLLQARLIDLQENIKIEVGTWNI